MSVRFFYSIVSLVCVATLLLLTPCNRTLRFAGVIALCCAIAACGLYLGSWGVAGASMVSVAWGAVAFIRGRGGIRNSGQNDGENAEDAVDLSGRSDFFRRVNAGLIGSALFGILLSLVWSNPVWRGGRSAHPPVQFEGSGLLFFGAVAAFLAFLIGRFGSPGTGESAS